MKTIVIKYAWKKFPEIPLGDSPDLRNFKFQLKSSILEKVSGKSPESVPGFFDRVSFELDISYLGAPTRHLLMPRDPLQSSSVVTANYFFWKKFPGNPLSHRKFAYMG